MTQNTTEIECTIKQETESAYLVEGDRGSAWIPKSQIANISRNGDEATVEIPEWLAIRNGLI